MKTLHARRRLAEALKNEGRQTRPCPSCPDGNVWTAEGPTGKTCPTCNGHGFVYLNGEAKK